MGSAYPLQPSPAPSTQPDGKGWALIPIVQVEDLQEAVLGAGLAATQMSGAPVTGSLAVTMQDDVILNTGRIGGRVLLNGVLSQSLVTFGLGLVLTPGSRQWLKQVETGDVGIFMPGAEHDALYAPGSLYAALTLPAERVEEAAAQLGLVLDPYTLGGSGIHRRRLSPARLAVLRDMCLKVHHGRQAGEGDAAQLSRQVLRDIILHLGREPRAPVGRPDPRGPVRIVARARAFIHAHLDQPLTIDMIVAAADTSERTLHRAFRTVLDETPYSYVLKQRLHRIRHALLSDAELSITISTLANRWGISELGRFAGWYDDLFGELPSHTRERYRKMAEHHRRSAADTATPGLE